MKNLTGFILCSFFLVQSAFSQNLAIELGCLPEIHSSPFLKGSKTPGFNSAFMDGSQSGIRLSISRRLKKNLFIKTELGYSTLSTQLNITYKDDLGVQQRLSNTLVSAQIHMGLLAEIRGMKKGLYGYLNAGLGMYSTVAPAFEFHTDEDLARYFAGNNMGIISGTGVGYSYRSIGIHAALNLNYIFPKTNTGPMPGLGFINASYGLGITYFVD